jgi:hypothetical protein
MSERSELRYRHQVGRLQRGAVRPAGTVRSGNAVQTAQERPAGPRVVLGMTLYNNARSLPDALESLLAQTHTDFVLVMLDDASSDETEAIARDYAARDARLRYFRHDTRRAMIATWREVVELSARECPSAEYFAWVSDHDRWHPRWLASLVAVLDGDPGTVLAYPITRRMAQTGEELEKGPRLFDTLGCTDLASRWKHFCANGVGAGDMVYGLMRIDALTRAGIFRTVLRPDRLLIAELTLQGGIHQVPEVLWFRRQSTGTSVERQRHTLVLPGDEPRGFSAPPWVQHTRALWANYAAATPPPLPLSRRDWTRMLARYQLTYGWRHLRKQETAHAAARAVRNVLWTQKMAKHYYRHAVYNTLVGSRAAWGKTKRVGRRALYEVLMFTHRIGLRGRGETPSR